MRERGCKNKTKFDISHECPLKEAAKWSLNANLTETCETTFFSYKIDLTLLSEKALAQGLALDRKNTYP